MRNIFLFVILSFGLWAEETTVLTLTSAPVDLNKLVELRTTAAGVPGTRREDGQVIAACTNLTIGTATDSIKLPLWLIRPLKPADLERLNETQRAAVVRLTEATNDWRALKVKFVAAEDRLAAATASAKNTAKQIQAIRDAAAKRNQPLKAADGRSFDAREAAASKAITDANVALRELQAVDGRDFNMSQVKLQRLWADTLLDVTDARTWSYSSPVKEAEVKARQAAMRQPIPMPAEAKK